MTRTLAKFLFVVIPLMVSAFSGDKSVVIEQSNLDSCRIIPFVGIDSIILGKSCIKDVEMKFGRGEKHREWRKAYEPFAIGQKLKVIVYPELGLKFIASRARRKERFRIQEIYITDPCKLKTINGVGIGSTLDDLRKEFGSIKVTYETALQNDKIVHSINVFCTAKNDFVSFDCYNTWDTAGFIVERIWMAHTKW